MKTDGGHEIDEKDLEELREDQEDTESITEDMETHTGTCRFCGQMGQVSTIPGWSKEQIDEAVTCKCQCERAVDYAKQIEQIQKAKNRITELFGAGAREKQIDTTITQNLISFVDIIADKKMQSVTVDIGHGLKAKVSRMAKGSIKVERTETVKASFEE